MLKAESAQAWTLEERGYDPARTEILGSKFLVANGFVGYRGTLEEHGKEALQACTLSGIYDRCGDAWREPVNAPNALLVRLYDGTRLLTPAKGAGHTQGLDFRHGIHRRESVLSLSGGRRLHVSARRFASQAHPGLLCLRYSLRAEKACRVTLVTGIDADVWDINGPHFGPVRTAFKDGLLTVSAKTHEGAPIHVVESVTGLAARPRLRLGKKSALREYRLDLSAGEEVTFAKFAVVAAGRGKGQDPAAAEKACRKAADLGWESALADTCAAWDRLWRASDVRVEGDPAAQKALRYSIYHLLSIAPRHTDAASIPARGLSGQVYKGAIFWDTEMFMLPFFNHTQPALARNLVRYRFHTLPGARRKAASLGHRGAFYAWESQETGDEACTLFNITDVITNRPLRTYFADKQVHISADVAHGVWQYYVASGDESVLLEGGAEVLAEVARFFRSWSYYNPTKGRYEILDVTGPDEYHERVHNNAYSSAMAKKAVGTALQAFALLKRRHPKALAALLKRVKMGPKELADLADLGRRLYVPAPDASTRVIEQFDGYHRLEEITVKDLKKRLLDPREYLGGGQGIATTTKVLKQADVVMMLNVLGQDYSPAVKKANWEFYEPRTEHGSSLSACVYALVAAAIGRTEWAYRYFMKTATVDLSGDSKQYVGSLYIGGTHPAANGGAWMAAVLGFGGLATAPGRVTLKPALPKAWKGLGFRVVQGGQWIDVQLAHGRASVTADAANTAPLKVEVGPRTRVCRPGEAWTVRL